MWTSIGRVSIALLIEVAGLFILQLGLKTFEKRLMTSKTTAERLKRLMTLARAGRSIGLVLISLIVFLIILRETGMDISPILASAGVVGLALSLGAQTVIKDFLGGVLILAENQFSIGDVITVGPLTGTVEDITLRATYLRDTDGKLNLIPNGDIRTLSNLTSQWAQVVVTLNLDYEADMEQATKVLNAALSQLPSEDETATALVEAPHVLGWTGFTDWAVQMQIIAKTHPGKQWLVARAIRKKALETLQSEGIRVAIPRQRVLN
jgi:small conductance mechanosensitive channel